jgi:hypothetical protein
MGYGKTEQKKSIPTDFMKRQSQIYITLQAGKGKQLNRKISYLLRTYNKRKSNTKK